jgi:hypothetical protein
MILGWRSFVFASEAKQSRFVEKGGLLRRLRSSQRRSGAIQNDFITL